MTNYNLILKTNYCMEILCSRQGTIFGKDYYQRQRYNFREAYRLAYKKAHITALNSFGVESNLKHLARKGFLVRKRS